ncbi:unnamed protein product, partial [marine sediment metagenome]
LGYWNYGFGYYVMLSETIYQATNGKVDCSKTTRSNKLPNLEQISKSSTMSIPPSPIAPSTPNPAQS